MARERRVPQTVRERRRGGHGFTLIELLVVIIILGIISGVVVFAVRGAGDKGEENARAADERIVRTAMEAFCARYGRYAANMEELVEGPPEIPGAKGFLSEGSTYNSTIVSVPPGENNCGGTGYQLIDDEPAKCFQLDDGVEKEATPQPEQWCLAAPPSGLPAGSHVQHLVQLLDGRVLSLMDYRDGLPESSIFGITTTKGHDTELFDPAAGDRGAWSAGPPAYTLGDEFVSRNSRTFSGMVPLTTRPGHDDCSPRCGKVLAYFYGTQGDFGQAYPEAHHWKLYNPEVGSPGTWTEIEPRSTVVHAGGGKAIQLLGPGCEPHCGKVLIVPRTACPDSIVELYDPKTNKFEEAGKYPPTWQLLGSQKCTIHPQLVELPSGKVLLVTASGNIESIAVLLGPGAQNSLEFFEEIGRSHKGDDGGMKAPSYYTYEALPTPVGEEPSVLFSHLKTEIYVPDESGGAGTWESQDKCARPSPSPATTTNHICHVTSALADGKVLVYADFHQNIGVGDPSSTTTLFDITKPAGPSRWSETGSLNDPATAGFGIRLARGRCGKHCNKVLMVGWNSNKAELYTPP